MIKRQVHHCACESHNKTSHSLVEESKRSGTLLNKAGYLLFPTDSLTRRTSLTGSEDIKDITSEFTSIKKKLKDLNKFMTRTDAIISKGGFDDPLVKRALNEELPEALNQVNYLLALKPPEDMKKSIDDLHEALQNALSAIKDVNATGQDPNFISASTKGTALVGKGNNAASKSGVSAKISDLDKKINDIIRFDAASLRQTRVNDDLEEVYHAFSANDPRYPSGEDVHELSAFFARKYNLVCVIPGSLIIDMAEGLVKHPEEEFISVTELSDDMKRRVVSLVQNWRAQDYQCANCTEDTHSLAFVIQAVGHIDTDSASASENDTYDPITTRNDLFIVGQECFGSLISDGKHYNGENTGDEDVLFTSKSTFDEVANSIKLLLMGEAKLKSLLETDQLVRMKNKKDDSVLIAPVLGMDFSDSLIRMLYCGRGEQLSRDLKRDENMYQPSTIGEIPVSNPKLGNVTMKRLSRLFTKTAQDYSDLNVIVTTDRESFSKAVKTQVQAATSEDSDRPVEEADIKKAGAKDMDKSLVRHAFSVLREVFDYNEMFLMRPYDNSIRIIGREINQEGYTSDFNTGFVITFTQDKDSLNMSATIPGSDSASIWKTLVIPGVPIKFEATEDEEGNKVKESIGSADIHYAFLRKKDCVGKEIKPLTSKDILQAVRNTKIQKDDDKLETTERAVLDCIKQMNDSLKIQAITITGKKEDDGVAVSALENIVSLWGTFLAEALKASYQNLSEIADKVELSTKAGNRSIIPLASSSDYLQGSSNNPNVQLREHDPERFSDPTGRTVIGGKLKSPGASDIKDATDLYWPSIQTILKNNGVDMTDDSGKKIKSKKAFTDFMTARGFMDRTQARSLVSQIGINNVEDAASLTTLLYKASSNLNEVPENRFLESQMPLGIKKHYL